MATSRAPGKGGLKPVRLGGCFLLDLARPSRMPVWFPSNTNTPAALLIGILSLTLVAAQETPSLEAPNLVHTPPPPLERVEKRGNWEWHVLRQDDREYVRFEDVQAFYRFETLDIVGDEVILESPLVTLRFLVGLQQAQVKGYKAFLSFPPVRFENRPYISRVDLSLLIDPTIRPPKWTRPSTSEPTILLQAAAEDSLSSEVAKHCGRALAAFEMKAITALPEEGSETPIFARIQLVDKADTDELATLSLAPYGTPAFGDSSQRDDNNRVVGNTQDKENVALAMALHATLMETVEGVLDGGLRRARNAFLETATEPAVTIHIPSESKASAEHLGAALVRGLRQFRTALEPQTP